MFSIDILLRSVTKSQRPFYFQDIFFSSQFFGQKLKLSHALFPLGNQNLTSQNFFVCQGIESCKWYRFFPVFFWMEPYFSGEEKLFHIVLVLTFELPSNIYSMPIWIGFRNQVYFEIIVLETEFGSTRPRSFATYEIFVPLKLGNEMKTSDCL